MSITIDLADKPKHKFTELICLDPGGKTGFARLSIGYADRTITIKEIGEFQTWSRLEELVKECAVEPLYGPNGCAIVYEGFTLRTMAANLIPVEVIGVLRYLCLKHQVHHFKQEPYERFAGRTGPNREEIICKWYPGLNELNSHYGSALRHGCFFITKHLFENKIGKLIYDKPALMKSFLN